MKLLSRILILTYILISNIPFLASAEERTILFVNDGCCLIVDGKKNCYQMSDKIGNLYCKYLDAYQQQKE